MKRDWQRKVTQVVWDDLVPWIDQIYAHHGYYCRISVSVVPTVKQLQPHVCVELVKQLDQLEVENHLRRTERFERTAVGGAAAAGLRIVSRMLLDLDNAAAAAEQRSLPLDDEW